MSSTVDSDMRASDAERNEVADKLSRHFAEGRLDQAEFKERLDRAMGATTRGDLGGLFDDLPKLHTDPPPPPPRRRRLIPLFLIVAFVAVAAGSTFSPYPFARGIHISWLLIVLASLYFWTRVRHRHYRHYHNHSPSTLEQ
jgi:hypothetical protein